VCSARCDLALLHTSSSQTTFCFTHVDACTICLRPNKSSSIHVTTAPRASSSLQYTHVTVAHASRTCSDKTPSCVSLPACHYTPSVCAQPRRSQTPSTSIVPVALARWNGASASQPLLERATHRFAFNRRKQASATNRPKIAFSVPISVPWALPLVRRKERERPKSSRSRFDHSTFIFHPSFIFPLIRIYMIRLVQFHPESIRYAKHRKTKQPTHPQQLSPAISVPSSW
jgi:hypothetical protein